MSSRWVDCLRFHIVVVIHDVDVEYRATTPTLVADVFCVGHRPDAPGCSLPSHRIAAEQEQVVTLHSFEILMLALLGALFQISPNTGGREIFLKSISKRRPVPCCCKRAHSVSLSDVPGILTIMPKQLSLKELRQYTFATNGRIAEQESGYELDEEPDEFTAFYHRDRGGKEEHVLVQDVNEITEESKWSPLLEDGFDRVAYLVEGSNPIPVGETEDGEIFELVDGGVDGLAVSDRVQIQLRQE